MLVGTRLDESAAPQVSEHAVPVGSDEEAGRDGDEVGQEQPTGGEQQQDPPEVAGEEVDVQAIVAAALARFTDAASLPPTTEALEGEGQRRRSKEAQSAVGQDEELGIVGAREAREVGPQELGVADKAEPKTGAVETCRHWAKGWCMRVDACRFAHCQPPVPRGVPQELLLILQAMACVGALSLDRRQGHSRGHGTLLQEVVVKAQGGGLPAVGYAVESGSPTEWAVALGDGDILEGLQFTRAGGADVWTAVHRQLPDAWPQVFRPPGHERLVGVEWRVWGANSPCPPVVVLPRRTSHPSWKTVAVLSGWVAVRGTDGHVFTAPRGTVIETDGGTTLQLTAEPLTTHVVVAVLQWGADKPQPWRDPVDRAVWRDLPALRAAVWPEGAGRHLLGALPWLPDCGDASPPSAELRGALEHLYSKPRHQFLVAADHGVELSNDVVALAADVVQCLAPHAMMLPREGWEGQRHNQTPAALLIARYVELGGSGAGYLDRLETPSMRHRTAHHLVAPDMRLTVDRLGRPVVSGAPPQWPHTWDMVVWTMRMAPRGQRAGWPGAEHLLAEARVAQVQQPAGNTKDCGVCALMSAVGALLGMPRPGNLLSALNRRLVAAVVHNRDMGPITRLPSLGELPAAVLDALPAPPHTLGRGRRPAQRGVARGALATCPAVYGGGSGRGDVHAGDGVPAARAGRDAAAADACSPAVGRKRQAVAEGGERAFHPYGGRGGYGAAGGVGRGGVLGLCSGGNRGTGVGRSHRVPAQEAAVQGPGLLPGVLGVPQGAGAGAQGTQVHSRGHPAGTGGLHGGHATAGDSGGGRLAHSPEQHVAG